MSLTAKDFLSKYAATEDHNQLEVCLVGAAISHGALEKDDTPKPGPDNLPGIICDGYAMYQYFVHGNRKKGLVLGSSTYFSIEELVGILGKAKFNGCFTLVLDTCYAGEWARQLQAFVDTGDEVLERLRQAVGKRSTYINFRLSSLPDEESRAGSEGSRYTCALVDRWRLEHVWVGHKKIDHDGWGTTRLTSKCPGTEETVWSIKKSEQQTDLPTDFVLHSDGNMSTHAPKDRQKFVK